MKTLRGIFDVLAANAYAINFRYVQSLVAHGEDIRQALIPFTIFSFKLPAGRSCKNAIAMITLIGEHLPPLHLLSDTLYAATPNVLSALQRSSVISDSTDIHDI